MKNKFFLQGSCVAVGCLLITSLPALAQAAEESSPQVPWYPTGFSQALVASVVFALLGILLSVLGIKLLKLVTPFDPEKEIIENKNVAVGLICGALVLGICHIVAQSMS